MSLEQDGAHLDDSDGCDQLFTCASSDRLMFQNVVVIKIALFVWKRFFDSKSFQLQSKAG